MHSALLNVKKAIEEFRNGKMVILVDHPDRENEGDLIIPAEMLTHDHMRALIRHTSGIVCLPMTSQKLEQLNLPQMLEGHKNTSARGTPFTVSIDAKHHITTGVSVDDRVETIKTAMKNDARPEDLVRPGHVFPLKAHDRGVLARPGHTEGSVDLARLAGFAPAAVLCELMNDDGSMMRGKELRSFAELNNLFILSIEDLITYRLATENHIEESATATVPLEKYGEFDMTVFKEFNQHEEHILLLKKPVDTNEPLLTRIHSSCTTGDLFGSCKCDCQKQLHAAFQIISEKGGALIYLRQEGRGIGLLNKMKTYALQENGMDTVDANLALGFEADSRQYYMAANILKNMGFSHIRLLTNNPAKVNELILNGITEVKQVPMPVSTNEFNIEYLRTKKEKMNHTINF